MDGDALNKAFAEAVEIAETLPEPYRVDAFRIAAEGILGRGAEPTVSHAPRVAQQTAAPAGELPSTVNELLALLHGRSHNDRFEAVIYWHLRQEGQDGVTTEDILNDYSQARLSRPGNPADVLLRSSRRGHIMDGARRDGQRTVRLTVTGERRIEQMLREAQETE